MTVRNASRGIVLASAIVAVSAGCPQGSSERPPSTDSRERLVLPAPDRDKVLLEMRQMLEAVDGIMQGLTKDDLAAVAEAARGAGIAMAVDLDPAIRNQLPKNFIDLGMRTHQAFDELAESMNAGGTREDAIRGLAGLTGNCVGCHASYRLDEAR